MNGGTLRGLVDEPAGDREDDDRRPRRSAADLIVQLATDRYILGRAEDGEPFAIERDGPNVARMFRGGRASLRLLWYKATGRDRRELTDTLDAATAMPGFRFAPSLGHRDELRRALENLRKNVDEDGGPEGELVVALALGLAKTNAVPRIW
jgi:hypothetical protein